MPIEDVDVALTQFIHTTTHKPIFAVSSENYQLLPSSILISSEDDMPELPFKLSDTSCFLGLPELANTLNRHNIFTGLRAFVNPSKKFWLTIFLSGLPNNENPLNKDIPQQ